MESNEPKPTTTTEAAGYIAGAGFGITRSLLGGKPISSSILVLAGAIPAGARLPICDVHGALAEAASVRSRIVLPGFISAVRPGRVSPTSFSAPEQASQKQALAHHFLLIHVEDNLLSGSAIDIDEQVIDQWAIKSQ